MVEVKKVPELGSKTAVREVYLVLHTTGAPSGWGELGGVKIWSAAFATMELAKQSVQILHNTDRQRRGHPPETLVWEDTIAKRPNGEWLKDVVLRIETVTTEEMVSRAS